ncbi:BldC family transcriptional regulator [Plantactinospora sp. CA-290183]|uniref:BldC family transcriptional regulator n=1 Tax=Plantactinospora sp. CA-290183 TaxID=3240006 RepID=UPI003D8C7B31
MHPTDRLLTPAEVAELFRVGPKTVTRWAAQGKLDSIRTPGRHRRFAESQVRALLEGRVRGTDPPAGAVPAGDGAALAEPDPAGPDRPT